MRGLNAVRVLGALLFTATAAMPVWSAQPACADFAWDVHQERSLFAGQAQSLVAGTDQDSAPRIQLDQLYELRLTSQQQVRFAMAPGKTMLSDGAYAGLVTLKVKQPGSYRVSLGMPFWIDVVSDGKLLPTKDFQGQRGCLAPRKIVEFVLSPERDLVLQFSGATAANLRLTVTRSVATTS